MEKPLTISINNLSNFKVKHVDFIKVVCGKLEPVLNWPVFEERVMGASYSNSQGKNGKQILLLLKTGADGKDKAPDGDIDLDAEGFHAVSDTIAYTYLGHFRNWFNTYFLDQYIKNGLAGEAKFAGTIIHELSHRAYRFTHPTKW